MKQIYIIVATIILFRVGLLAQNSPYVSQVIEYKPAPGQFTNTLTWGSPSAAQSIIGGINGHISLGAYGGYIVVGFDHSIENDPNNPYGVDFSIFGNAFTGWSEPGIVQVMKDENQNGLPDDTWYLLKGSEYNNPSTINNYVIMYANPGGYANVPWRDNRNHRGAILSNPYHTQPYYPSVDSFPDVNPISETYQGMLISGNIDDSNPNFIKSYTLDYGYADNHTKKSGDPITQPDNPATIDIIEGAGGDAMKIEWAVDDQGNPVSLDKIDFVKIYTGLNRNCGWLGEVSTEICGVVNVDSENSAKKYKSTPETKSHKENFSEKTITIFTSSDNEKTFININGFEIFNINGKLVLKSNLNNIDNIDFSPLEKGIYLAKAISKSNIKSYQIVIE